MAQAPPYYREISRVFIPESDLSGRIVVGFDGFPWRDGGIEGDLHRRFDWILKARVVAAHQDADRIVKLASDWVGTLPPLDRARAGLSLVARWHWLWNAGALDGIDDDDSLLANLVFLVDKDISSLIESTLWWTPRYGLTADVLEQMVLWSASALFDRSDLWPRTAVLHHLRQSLDSGVDFTPELIEAIELLLAAEQRDASKTRGEPESQIAAITEMLERLCPVGRRAHQSYCPQTDAPTLSPIVRTMTTLERLSPVDLSEWARMLLDPMTWCFEDLRRTVIGRLRQEALLDTPEIRAALAGARASSLALEPICWDSSIVDDLRSALHRPN